MAGELFGAAEDWDRRVRVPGQGREGRAMAARLLAARSIATAGRAEPPGMAPSGGKREVSEQAAQRTWGDALGVALSERAGPGQPAGGQDGCRFPSAGVRRRPAWRTAARDPGRLARELALLGDRRLDPHTLRVEAIERMRGALPIDGYCSSLADPATLCQAWVAGEGVDWSLAPAYYRIELCEPDFAKHVELVRGQSPVRVLSQAARGELERSPRYREVLGPLGGSFWGFEARSPVVAGIGPSFGGWV